jgi:hypothetical protein
MAPLTDQQIAQYAYDAGFRGDALNTAVAVALAESGGDPSRLGDVGLENGTWGPSVGLWQIRSVNPGHGNATERAQRNAQANLDPATNAANAYAISHGGTNFGPWSTYTHGDYRRYLTRARTAAAAVRQPTGGTPATGGGAAPSAYQVAPGSLRSAARHTDAQQQRISGSRQNVGTAPAAGTTSFGKVTSSQRALQAHQDALRRLITGLESAVRRLGVLSNGLSGAAGNYTSGDQQSAGKYTSLLSGQP